MSETARSRAASLAHLRRDGLAKGDPIPLPLTMAAIFHNPGDGAGYSQYGRYSNATWDAVEHMLAHLEDAPCVGFPSGMAAICCLNSFSAKSLMVRSGTGPDRVSQMTGRLL